MSSQLILKNFKQNDIRINNKNIFKTSKYYNDALIYNGYHSNIFENNKVIYPMPIIKNSKTYMKQASLSSLPVQQLEKSFQKYLKAVKPLLNENEFDNTNKIVNNFIQPGGLGEKLQKLLYERSKNTDNWLAQWWLDKVYLEPRYGVAINVNPNILYPKANYKSIDEQLVFATNYIYGVLEYKKLIDTQQLPIEKHNNLPLCMDQYYKIFNSCRVPHKNKDLLKMNQSYLNQPKHITVMYKNRIFSLQVIENHSDNALSKEEILANLKHLVENTDHYVHYNPSIFTAEDRDTWASVYDKLRSDENNKQNFDSIHDSLFVLCLDNEQNVPQTNDDKSLEAAQLLHGNKIFSLNRWFDKTIQVIIAANGVYGLNFEHSVAEALPFANLGDFVLSYMSKQNQPIQSSEAKSNFYKELVFNVPTDIKAQIDSTKLEFFKRIDDLDLLIFQFESFGKNFPKSQKISPDAFVQIAMQLAFFKLHKKWGNAYESGSLRRFALGRTDIIRSCSDETVKFLQSTVNNNSSNLERALLLKNAITNHSAYSNYVLNFESFDRHLMGLKLIAIENNIEIPELYKDTAFQKLCHYHLSSSQVSSKSDAVCSYGPAVNDGYGICYNILEKKLMFGLSAFNSNHETSTKLYAKSLNESLLECQSILLYSINSKL